MILAIYPYSPDGCSYMGTMQGFLSNKYHIIDYYFARNGIVSIEDVDVVYLNWIEDILTDSDRLFLIKAKEVGISIVWVFHNRIPHDSEEEKTMNRIIWLADICSTIILHSRKSLDVLSEMTGIDYSKKTVFLPHPDYIDDLYGSIDLRRKFGFAENDVVFGFLGQLRPYKNIELLIECFRTIKKKGKESVKLIISGRKESNEYFETLLTSACGCNDVIIDGEYISAIDMKSYLDAIDILVLPYNKRSSMNSGSMIMSFSYSRTVIVPNISMAEDYNTQDIYVYSYNNEEEHRQQLLAFMMRALDDGRKELLNKGASMREYVKEFNSKAQVRRELLEIV